MRSTIALATLFAFLTAPVAAKAQVAAGAHVDVVNGEIEPYLNVDPFGIASDILPGDQPQIESDTKTKVAIGLIGVAVGFGLAMLLNKDKSNDNGGASTPNVPTIPPVSIPDGRLPIPGGRDTIGGTGTSSTPVPGSGTVSVPGGSTAGSGSGEVSSPSAGSGSGRVGSGRGVDGGSVSSGTVTNTPGSNVGRNANTRPVSTGRSSGYFTGEMAAGTPR